MKDYTYDGSFNGLLCCIYAHYYIDRANSITARNMDFCSTFFSDLQSSCESGGFPSDCLSDNSQDSRKTADSTVQFSLFSDAYDIETDQSIARKVQDAIESKISNFDLCRIYRVFLSCAPNREMMILKYVVLGFKSQAYFSLERSHPDIYEIQVWDKRVGFEVHRLKGLVRFDELENGVMYSRITPDNDIAELLAPHFAERFRSCPFIIHDIARNKAVLAADGEWFVTKLHPSDVPQMSPGTKRYSELWRIYHEHIAIAQRKNSRCQRNFMPIRYWPNLTEMD